MKDSCAHLQKVVDEIDLVKVAERPHERMFGNRKRLSLSSNQVSTPKKHKSAGKQRPLDRSGLTEHSFMMHTWDDHVERKKLLKQVRENDKEEGALRGQLFKSQL